MAQRQGRIQVRPEDALSPERFRPEASPSGAVSSPQAKVIDTYVQPASTLNRNAGSGMAQLAQALSGFAPSLARFTGVMQDKKNEQDTKDGAEMALNLQKEGVAYKTAIEKGLIDPHQSKFYLAGVKEQMGQAAAGQFDDALHAALQQSEDLKYSTDPTKFDAFAAKFRKEWEPANIGDPKDDQQFTLGYNARVQQHIEQRRSEFVNQIGPKLKTQSIAAHYSDLMKTATDETGKVGETELATAIDQKNKDLIAQGRDSNLVYNTTMRALNDAALRAMEDPSNRDKAMPILNLMAKVTGVDGVALNDSTDEARDSYLKTFSAITHSRNVFAALDSEQQKLADEKTKDEAYTGALKALFNDPTVSLMPFIKQVSGIRGAAEELLNLRSVVKETSHFDDEHTVNDITSDIWLDSSKVSAKRILAERNKGNLTLATANHLLDTLEQKKSRERQDAAADRAANAQDRQARADERRAYRDLVSDPLYTKITSELQSQFVGSSGILAGAQADAAKHAAAQLQQAWIEWNDGKGAEATPIEKARWLDENSDAIVRTNRRGLLGFDTKGEPLVKPNLPPEKPAAAAKAPELQAADLEVIDRIAKGENPTIPASLQAKFNSLGSYDAVKKYVMEQAALHAAVRKK